MIVHADSVWKRFGRFTALLRTIAAAAVGVTIGSEYGCRSGDGEEELGEDHSRCASHLVGGSTFGWWSTLAAP